MLTNLANVVRVKDLRNKILFTLFIIAVYRLGSHVPVPGISFERVEQLRQQSESGGVLGFLNLFSGGALTRFSVFSLGIMPYITSSIIIQLLQTVIPKLDQWRQEGPVGQRKLTQTTRYVTMVIALVQSTGLGFAMHNGGGNIGFTEDLFVTFNTPRLALVVLTMTAGTAIIMWLGETVTARGIGQGMSILIFANVVAGLPAGGAAILAESGRFIFTLAMLFVIAMLVAIVFVEQGQRRIPVMFAKRQVGRRLYGGQSTYIPMKVNQSGIIPIIFASSVLYFPVLLSNVIGSSGWRGAIQRFINDRIANPADFVYISLYFAMIIGFAYFYSAISFDPHQQADYIKKQGGYIPGIRPGAPTERYLNHIMNRITLPGAMFIGFLAVSPSILFRDIATSSFPFVGTTILISVGVALETMKQIDSQLMMRNYEGFLAK
ncbi:MAG TPA: preprotein translocase subunit SecY [Acidimicrobiales bacterium]|nr:preprotein translocase subunit SecY [Acidimicrobiales bacterium]